jgi:hypothetical protein
MSASVVSISACSVCLQAHELRGITMTDSKIEFALCPACGRQPLRLFDRDYRRRACEFAAGPRPPERPGLQLFACRRHIYEGVRYRWVYTDKTPHHPLYNTWRGMLLRCYDETRDNYKYYGARGVTVCKRWRDSLEAFAADMGPRPAGTTLDRKNPYGNYTPNNCRWATPQQQAGNKRPRKKKRST